MASRVTQNVKNVVVAQTNGGNTRVTQTVKIVIATAYSVQGGGLMSKGIGS